MEELDAAQLMARGVRGVMLDLDNTIAPWRGRAVCDDVLAWVESLKAAEIRACLVTNSFNIWRVRPVAEQLGLPWVAGSVKPLSLGFRRGMRAMDTVPETSAMVGDLLTMDVCGANHLGIYSVLVHPRSPHDQWFTKHIQRPIERWLGHHPQSLHR